VQISGTVASADAECHCSDQQVCLGCSRTLSLITMSYIIRTKRFIWKDLRLLLLHSLGVYLVIHRGLGIIRGLPPQRGINGLVVGMITGFTVGCLLIRKPIFVVQELIR
jgi:hypothetical protein